jgi:putative SOS response-associated peptidase YedK
VIPVPAYYEWTVGADGKEPWMMRSADRDVLFMAGLYEFKQLTDEERAAGGDDPTMASGWLVSATILTTEARGHLAEVHDRMPVMLEPATISEWIAPDGDADHAAGVLDHVLETFDPNAVERVRVGTAVGNVRNQGAQLAEPLGEVLGGRRSE